MRRQPAPLLLLVLVLAGPLAGSAQHNATRSRPETSRGGRVFSLFSIVQFPNLKCTSSSSTTTYGTCLTSSECSSKSGSSDGNCAAGFGVCCIISTSTCSSTISTNTSYIRNPGYPSTYTPGSTGTCVYTVSKTSSDICQLRLDFQTMSGFVTGGTTAIVTCTDSFTALGSTGKTVPSICGTNTDYHMYIEFGATSTDTVTLTHTLGSTTSTLKWNILAQQIPCTATYRAPTDCLQYFTGRAGVVYSYNFAGAQFLGGMDYTNCIRTEKDMCAIQWKEKTGATPDSFHVFATAVDSTATIAVKVACPTMNVYIPSLSYDGIQKLGAADTAAATPGTAATQEYQSTMCGSVWGVVSPTQSYGPQPLTSRAQPFILGVHSAASGTPNVDTNYGFALEYTQVGCL